MTVSVPLWPAVFGRFGWQDLPFVRAWENPVISEIIGAFAGALVVIGAVVLAALLTRFG